MNKKIGLYSILRDYKDIHKGKRAFVVGNGPSLNLIDMSKLKNEITIGSNRVYLGYDKWGIKCKYWAIEDSRVSADTAEEWNSIPHETKFIPYDLEHLVTNWDNVCLVNFERSGGWKKVNKKKVFYPAYSTEPRIVHFGFTVTYMMLQIASIMGCDPIYLIGCDHYYKRTTDVEDGQSTKLISSGEDPDHFDPTYFGEGKKYHKPRTDLSEHAYHSANITTQKRGLNIYNATPTTKLEVFKRVKYEELFKED